MPPEAVLLLVCLVYTVVVAYFAVEAEFRADRYRQTTIELDRTNNTLISENAKLQYEISKTQHAQTGQGTVSENS